MLTTLKHLLQLAMGQYVLLFILMVKALVLLHTLL